MKKIGSTVAGASDFGGLLVLACGFESKNFWEYSWSAGGFGGGRGGKI